MAFAAEELGVEVTQLLALHREVSPVYDAASVKRLVAEIRRVRPHILHTHTAKAGAVGRMAALLAGDAKPPVVVHTFHGHVLRGYFDPMLPSSGPTVPPSLPTAWHLMHARPLRSAKSPRPRPGSPPPFIAAAR